MTDLPGPGGMMPHSGHPSRLLLMTLTIPGEPIGKGRPRSRVIHSRSGSQLISHYTPTKTRTYEARLASLAKQVMQDRDPVVGPVELTIEAQFSIPKSWSKRKRETALAGKLPMISRPDCDNSMKCVGDALNKIAWQDDSQIVTATIRKFYGANPGLTIQVWALT